MKEIYKMAAFYFIFFMMMAMCFRCDTSLPTAPPLVGDGAGGGVLPSSSPSSTTPPPTIIPPVNPTGTLTGSGYISGNEVKGRVENGTAEDVPCFLAVYLRPGTQHRYSMDTVNVKPLGSRRLATDLPLCGCEDILVQWDLNCYEEPPEVYTWPEKMPGMMIDNGQHTVKPCKECPGPCEPEGEKECPEQVWDYDLCKYVGDCGCPPFVCEPPHVANPVTCKCECPPRPNTTTNGCFPPWFWNTETCSCECPLFPCGEGYHEHPGECGCFCDPVGEPECPEQVWDEDTCEWVGECPCEPVGDPECPEQKWDPVKCKWVGECCTEPELLSWDGCYERDDRYPGYKLEGWGNATVRGKGDWKLCLVAYRLGGGYTAQCHPGPKDCDEDSPDCWETSKLEVHWKTTLRDYAKNYGVELQLWLDGVYQGDKSLGQCR